MPGKHGFGDTRKKSSQSPAYKKQKFGEAKSPFMMKGYSYPGHSPLRQTKKKPTEKKTNERRTTNTIWIIRTNSISNNANYNV